MALAAQWYSSGTFWTATGAIAVLISGTIAAYLAIRQEQSRRLNYMISVAPLLRENAKDMPGDLRITWHGDDVQNAYVIGITLFNPGRRDISRDDFEEELEFRVKNAEILGVLRTDSGPNSSPFKAEATADKLTVGRGLIHRHEFVKVTLLATGQDPKVTCSAAAVRDTIVRAVSSEAPERHWSPKVKVTAGLAAGAAMAGLIFIGLVIGHASTTPPAASHSRGADSSQAPALLRKAELDLTSGSHATQLGGISLAARIMGTWPAEQPAAVEALAKFIRQKSPAGRNDRPIAATIQAALNVLRSRKQANDHDAVIDLSSTNLSDADMSGINLNGATLVNTDLTNANLANASLQNANLNYAFVGGANLAGTNLAGANLVGASFYRTIWCHGSQPAKPQRDYNCSASG
jgi:hypothetical protein